VCGICGIANYDTQEPINPKILERMRDVLNHRGPDDAGSYIEGPIGFGARRLAILDVTAASHQPMTTNDASLVIVFNGEIYNYIELRRDHLDGRYHFSTKSDTEVLVRLYDRFGEDCVEFLNGMFAFAIWDRKRRKLFLARDRFGVKPLYYTVQNGSFIFSSEIKSLLQHPKVSTEISPTAVDQFITYGYVLTAPTVFSNIHHLPAGHTLTWQDGQIAVRRYWDMKFEPREDISAQEHGERLLDLLNDSVRLRLRTDVPAGVLLSGGVDSTAVTALVSRSTARTKTFSIGFDAGKEFNELKYARRVAERYGTDHHEMVLDTRRFVDFFPRFIYYMDEPVTEASGIPLYFVSELAGRHVKVLLSGEGADELFAGYPIYHYMTLIESYRRIPAAIRNRLLNPLLEKFWPSAKIGKYTYLSGLPLERRYLNVNLYDPRLRQGLYSKGFRESLGTFDSVDQLKGIYGNTGSSDVLAKMLYLDMKGWLPNDILLKADRMSMAASVELRVPFLDYRLVEYAATIPSRYKLRLGKTKYIFRKAFSGIIPKDILRRPKMGFPVPLSAMFRGELGTYARNVLLDPRAQVRDYFDWRFVRRLLNEHIAGRADHHLLLWPLLILEEWHRQFVDSIAVRRTA
jgi:asparagine synthase (glutamine-hydrolysing)